MLWLLLFNHTDRIMVLQVPETVIQTVSLYFRLFSVVFSWFVSLYVYVIICFSNSAKGLKIKIKLELKRNHPANLTFGLWIIIMPHQLYNFCWYFRFLVENKDFLEKLINPNLSDTSNLFLYQFWLNDILRK